MRLNIEWVAPWLHGKPIRTWLWHIWAQPVGPIQGLWSGGFTLFGLHTQLTRDSLWSGVGLSINV